MGEPITGQWSRTYTAPFSDASKWGTGINPIHAQYGSAPLRVYGRNNEMPDVHLPGTGGPEDIIELAAPWGYQPEDIAGLDVYALDTPEANYAGIPFDQDGWPDWGDPTTNTRANTDPRETYPVSSPGGVPEHIRGIRWGPGSADMWVSKQVPTETVSEGWVNKPASGMDEGFSGDDVIVSDPSQYEVQTSMTQRTKAQNNDRSQLRGTDDAREPISSRIVPMRLKVYSEGERHYDMTPRDMDDIPRPFWYRTAGTGRNLEMLPNEMVVITPLQRTPPPDPTLGPQEISVDSGGGFGYTAEDQGWY